MFNDSERKVKNIQMRHMVNRIKHGREFSWTLNVFKNTVILQTISCSHKTQFTLSWGKNQNMNGRGQGL